MSVWRVIFTDTESASGVAPVCPLTEANHLIEDEDGAPLPGAPDVHGVYDCCPGPRIELWSEQDAAHVAEILTSADAEICS